MLDRPSDASRTPDGLDLAASSLRSGEVVPFPVPQPSDLEVRLDWLRDQVASGRVESLGVAIAYKDGSVNTMWTRTANAGSLMGAVALLQQRLCRDD